MAAGVAGALEQAQRAVLEPRHDHARVVDPDRLELAGFLVPALLHEGLGLGDHARDRPVQPERRVDAVREQVAGDARARGLGFEPPERRAALGQIGGNRPVLEELRPVVEGAADPALVDQLLRERDRRHAPVVVADEVRHARALDRGRPSPRPRPRSSQAASRRRSSCRPRRPRARSRRAGDWACRCRRARCPAARPGAASRSRRWHSPRRRRTPKPWPHRGRPPPAAPAGARARERSGRPGATRWNALWP